MKGVAPREPTFTQIYAAAAPFVILNLVTMALLLVWPQLITGVLTAFRLG